MRKLFPPQKFRVKKSDGFTLIELLMVTVIIGVLTAAFFVSYRTSGQQFAVLRSAQKLAQDVRRTGEMAMSAKECCGGLIPAGYGVWLEEGNSYYIIYADTQPPSGNGFYTPSDTTIETVPLESGVTIQGINTSNGKAGINFAPPSPTITIKFSETTEIDTLNITLAGGGNTKQVNVNAVGLIEVQ